MGNRACIMFAENEKDVNPAVYLHWNGGPESVYAFLDYMVEKQCRMGDDPSYATARFAQIAGTFFGGTLSVGVLGTKKKMTQEEAAEWYAGSGDDNGTYVVLKGSPFTVRRFDERRERPASEVEFEAAVARKDARYSAMLAGLRESLDATFAEEK